MLAKIRTSVVNLDKYRENYERQLPHLLAVGLNPERFSAINAIQDQHLEYGDKMSLFARYFTPKCTIGCSLSHILLCEKLFQESNLKKDNNNNNNKIEYFLIMEDDCFPHTEYNTVDTFRQVINETIQDITIIDPDWDLIQLHSDALFPTHSTYHTHFFCGSTAAYLLSKRGLEKMSRERGTNHLDFVTQNFIKYNKYRARRNIFYTDETSSLQRKTNGLQTLRLKKAVIERLIPLRGEKDWGHFLQFKMIKIPGTEYELTSNEILDYLFAFYIVKKMIRQ